MSCIGKTTLEKGGRDPPDVSLEDIVDDLLLYFYNINKYCKAKKEAEDIYGIIKEHDDCWPAKDIKQAWRETQRMKESSRRRHWSLVIMMQVIQKQQAGHQLKARKRREGEENLGSTGDIDQDLVNPKRWKGRPEDKSTGGVKQCSGGNLQMKEELIRVPFLQMIPLDDHKRKPVEKARSTYKLTAAHPGPLNSEIRKRKSYVMSFNKETGNANWVYELLNGDTTDNKPVRAEPFGDPYDRGHLAAVANHRWCQEAFDDANMIDNIVPQHWGLNRGPWKKFESECRSKAKNINVHVYSGPLYLRDMNPRVIGEKRVPSHFFKVIIEENKNGRVNPPRYYLFPNQDLRSNCQNEDIEQYSRINNKNIKEKSVEEILQKSGLTFTDIRPSAEACEITGTLRGKDGNTVQCTAKIQVIIAH